MSKLTLNLLTMHHEKPFSCSNGWQYNLCTISDRLIDRLYAKLFTLAWLIIMLPSLLAQQWVRSQTQWWPGLNLLLPGWCLMLNMSLVRSTVVPMFFFYHWLSVSQQHLFPNPPLYPTFMSSTGKSNSQASLTSSGWPVSVSPPPSPIPYLYVQHSQE